MVDRYRLQIGEQGAPAARQRHFGVDDGGLAGAAEGFGKNISVGLSALARRREEEDMLAVEAAANEYTKWNLDYTNNPDTGIFNAPKYKFGGARGIVGLYEGESKKKAGELEKTLSTPEQKRAFMKVALRQSMPFYKSAQDYEAAQLDAFRDAETQNTIETGRQAVLMNPLDDDAMALFAENAERAIGLNMDMAGAPEESVRRAVADAASKMDSERISNVALNDPMMAERMIKASKWLLPADKAALSAKNKAYVELVKTQAFADETVARFGTDAAGVKAAWDYIDKHYSGTERETRKQAYNARVGEAERLENLRDREKAERQNENFARFAGDFYFNGGVPDSAALERLFVDEDVSPEQFQTLIRWQETAETRAGIEKRLSRNVPGWNGMTPQRREEAVMEDAGRTAGEREDELNDIEARVVDGTITDLELTAAYNNMYITSGELARYKKAGAAFKGYGKSVRDVYNKRLNEGIDTILDNLTNSADPNVSDRTLRNAAKVAFFEDTEGLDPKDPKYEEKLSKAAANALGKAIEMSKEPMTGRDWRFRTIDTAFAGVAAGAAERVSAPAGVARPEFFRDDISLRETLTEEDMSMDLLGGEYAMTSGYDRPRDGGKRLHGGYDFAAPKGTPVFAPWMFGGDTVFTVERVVNSQSGAKSGAGNSVTLAWTDAGTGNKYQIQLNHLDAAADNLKAGMTVQPGALLGTVGNTGSVIADKGDGSHLDMKFKLNGKNTDILKWFPDERRRRREAEDSELDAIMRGNE
jgi:murein DD-endopeptidase MepM/ murein hydrolase activator NlpD